MERTFARATASISRMSVASHVRVRYAPSPTGSLHLGGLRTALYNYLFARATGGVFVLRIEDTDRSRLVPGSAAALARMLEWCCIAPDEGPVFGTHDNTASNSRGPYGPYVQSKRLPLYTEVAAELLHSGHAYRCFCTPERLAALRESQTKLGRPSLYDRVCAHLPPAEASARAAAGEPHVIRMRVPAAGGATVVQDTVLGNVRFALAGVDDQVLIKSDGFPTYHLAAVVDDHAMKISHVIRGQEWLPSTPKHLLLHAALGWTPPVYAHLPLLLNTERGKLSKRAGDSSVEDFKSAGYSPEALLNFVALLGWTPPARDAAPLRSSGSGGSGRSSVPAPQGAEVLTLDDMVAGFRLEGIHKANAVVDRARLDYFNGEHIRRVIRGARAAATVASHGSSPPISADADNDDAVPAELVLEETSQLVGLRNEVFVHLDALLAELLAESATMSDAQSSGSTIGGLIESPVSKRLLSSRRFNAALVAQVERVHRAADFAPLLVPFAASPAEFAAWRARALRRAVSGTGKLAKLALTESSTSNGIDRQPRESAAAAVSALLARVCPALAEVADGWDALPRSAFGDGSDAPLVTAKGVAATHGLPVPTLLLSLRLALTGSDVGATLSVTMALLGQETCVRRAREFAGMTTEELR